MQSVNASQPSKTVTINELLDMDNSESDSEFFRIEYYCKMGHMASRENVLATYM